jgi:hypothetical protein
MGFLGELLPGGQKKIKTPTPPEAPAAPDPKVLEAQERAKQLEKKRRTVGTLLTSSSGLEQDAPAQGKSLLGG